MKKIRGKQTFKSKHLNQKRLIITALKGPNK